MKKRYVCLLAGLAAVMLVGCGAKEAATTSTPATQESAITSSAESTETASEETVASSESKDEVIGAGPDYVVMSRKDSVSYWDEEEEDMVEAQNAVASELVILSPGYEKLKAAIEVHNAEARDGMEEALESARSFLEDEEDLSYAFFPWESTTDMHVTRSDAQLFSYIINYYDYMGGAHGYYYSRAYNYEPATGKELQLTDLVTDLSKLHELVVEQIKDEWDTEELFDEWEDTIAAEFETPEVLNFLAGPDTICIWFDTYDIAPYVCGEIETIFAMEDYEGLFNEAYFHPENAEVEPGKVVLGTELFQNVVQTLSEQIGKMNFNETKDFLDKAGYAYEEGMPGAEVDGAFYITDPENEAIYSIFFWPEDVESDEDYTNPEKNFIGYMRYEMNEEKSGWIGREYYNDFVEYAVINENYEVLYFDTVEEMTRYLFY